MPIARYRCMDLGLCLALMWAGSLSAQSNTLDFDGVDDRVAAPLPPTFSDLSNNSFTVAVWVRPASGGGTTRVFFAQQSATEFASLLIGASANPNFYVYTGGSVFSVRSDAELPLDEWSHLAARWNHASQSVDLMINGELTMGPTGGFSSVGSDGIMMIGARTDGAQTFLGRLDDLNIWSTVRSLQQLRAEVTGTCYDTTGLIASYDFNQGVPGGDNSGLSNLPDVSGGGFTGSLLNFALNGAASNWLASDTPVADPGLVFDPPIPALLETGEDGSGFSTTLRLSAAPEAALSVAIDSDDASEGTATPSSLDFTPENWDVPQNVSFVGVDDTDFDGAVDYAFNVSVSGPAGACWTSLADVLNARNASDDIATLSTAGATVNEGDTGPVSLVFDVTLDVDYAGGFSLPFTTLDDTALAGIDYQASSGTLDFNGSAGEIQQVSVAVLPNTQSQGNRRLLLEFGSPTQPDIVGVPSQVEGLILDDDIDLSVVLTPIDVELLQGAATGYSVRVENHSPLFDAENVLVDSISIPSLDATSWSCSAFSGAACSPSGMGEPSESVSLPAGSHVIFDVTGSAPASGSNANETLELMTSITPAVADSDALNNSDAATLTVLSFQVFADSFEPTPPPE